MAKSPEYSDLSWVPPRAFGVGRPYGPPLWIVVHTTEGSEGLKSAEDGAAYDTWRPDGTSTHYFHDQDSTVQCVLTTDRANAAMATGNHYGIHHELCGVAAQSPAQWHDAASAGTLRNFAKQAARDAKKWGIPVRRLTTLQVRNHEKGFCEHKNISDAFRESDHQDPGKNYPWDEVLGMIRAEMGATVRELTYQDLDGYALPILKHKDDDADRDGYDRVHRAQCLLGYLGKPVDVDGIYGDQTAGAIRALGFGDGKTIDLPVWVKLYGLTRAG